MRAGAWRVINAVASAITNDSSVVGSTVKDALNTLQGAISSGVSSVFGRTGAVVAAANDYNSTQVSNSSGVAGTGVTGALNTLNTNKVDSTRTISTTAPLTGGGDLSTNRTFALPAPGYYRATDGANTAATNGNRNFQYASGGTFVEASPGGGLTFTAAGCQVKNTSGVTKSYLVRVYASVFQGASSPGFIFMNIDNNGDLQGTSVVAAGVNYSAETFVDAAGDEFQISIEKKISVVNNGIIRAIWGATDSSGANPISSNIGIDQLAMIVQECTP